MEFKNSFAWLTGMIKLIFCWDKFFCSGYFSIHEILKKWPKSDRSQKSQYGKKIVFWCLSTMRRNFWTPFMLWPYFYDCFWKLWPVSAYSLDLFSKKFLAQIITLAGLMGSGIWESCKYSSTYLHTYAHNLA